MNAYDIIIKPVITEQSMEDVADKKYVFQVAINANKTEIKAAVEEIFGVKVKKVNTIRMQGKVKRTGAYPAGRRAAYKKAIVTLTADSKTIEFFEAPGRTCCRRCLHKQPRCSRPQDNSRIPASPDQSAEPVLVWAT